MSQAANGSIGGNRWGNVRPTVLLRVVTVAIVVAAILRFAYWIVYLARESPQSLGVDYQLHMRAAQRLLEGGSFYEPWQLAGSYTIIGAGEILYPPIALALFLPFTVLPWVLWWALPAVIAAAALWRIRPRLIAGPLLAFLVLYPRTQEVILWGNPTMWILAFALAGVAWGWPGALVLLKPTLLPFGLFGVRNRGWWGVVVGLAAVGVATIGLWGDWFAVLSNAYGASPLYSLVDVPTMCIVLVAAVGRSPHATPNPGPAGRPPADRLHAMHPPSSLTVVLPAYNEEARLGPALDELFGYLRRHGERGRDGAPGAARLPDDVRVLVVDDGSADGTADLVRARPEAAAVTPSGASLLALLAAPHGGKGAAVKAGMLAAETDLAIFADADMATPPDQLPLLVEALRDHDLALGSRIQPDGSDMRRSQPGIRRLLGQAFHVLASVWAVGHVQDTQCGFKGFTREAANDLFAQQKITGIVFDVELIYLARRHGYRIAVVPIVWSDKHGSRMHPGLVLGLGVAWDLIRTPFLHRRVPRRRG